MPVIIKSATLLFLLLNPFLLIVYLADVINKLEQKQFVGILVRAGLISAVVFCLFALMGDAVFSEVIQADFASFQIFGGLILLIIGYQFVFKGIDAIEILRGESQHLAGAIAMPLLIGPGTISAAILIGKNHTPLTACLSILAVVTISVIVILLLKALHDFVKPRNEPLIQRYFEVMGRITALFVGTVAIEMIMRGLQTWWEHA